MNTDESRGPVVVSRPRDIFEARLVAGYLEAAGIPAHIPDEEMIRTLDGAAAMWSGGVKVVVHAAFAEEARQILAERKAALHESGGLSDDMEVTGD